MNVSPKIIFCQKMVVHLLSVGFQRSCFKYGVWGAVHFATRFDLNAQCGHSVSMWLLIMVHMVLVVRLAQISPLVPQVPSTFTEKRSTKKIDRSYWAKGPWLSTNCLVFWWVKWPLLDVFPAFRLRITTLINPFRDDDFQSGWNLRVLHRFGCGWKDAESVMPNVWGFEWYIIYIYKYIYRLGSKNIHTLLCCGGCSKELLYIYTYTVHIPDVYLQLTLCGFSLHGMAPKSCLNSYLTHLLKMGSSDINAFLFRTLWRQHRHVAQDVQGLQTTWMLKSSQLRDLKWTTLCSHCSQLSHLYFF